MTEYSGRPRGGDYRVGIVVGRFNEIITERLLSGARSCLVDHGIEPDRIEVAWAPGAWELPLAAQLLVGRRQCNAVVALGCVIRGDTPHFDFVAGAAANGLSTLQASTGVPVGFGVLTTDNMEQALARAGGKAGNKGWEAALAVLEMLDLAAGMEDVSGA